jgi:hypothetical protein
MNNWLIVEASNVLLSSFGNDLVVPIEDLIPWLEYHQSNVLLSAFSNDLAPWLNFHQSNVFLSSFSNDITHLDLESLTIVDTLYCSNISSDETINIFSDSNVIINDIFEVRSNELVTISTDLSLGKSLTIVDTLYCSNISSDETINIFSDSNVVISGNNIVLDASNINIADMLLLDSELGVFTLNTNVVIKGNLEVGSLTIQAYEEKTRILNIAYSNLNDYFEVDNGLVVNGAIFTPHENVFTKPTYFLSDIYLSSNLNIDPIFNVDVEARKDLIVFGGLIGNPDNSNGLMIKDNSTFYGPATFQSNVIYYDTNSNGFWKVFTDTIGDKTCDLIFQSRNNIATAFTDEFNPNIINFTGQHRCTGRFASGKKIDDMIGKIVVASGEYSDLYNNKVISINEAIPIVKLCAKSKDAKVFGVISDEESDDTMRVHHLGFMKFKSKKKIKNKKYMINSVGEGGVWICNINGNLENGDYITSSVVSGYGMKQDDSIHYNYTVAKITCDCDFDLKSKIYKCEEFVYRNLKYRKAFVGCVYKC